MGTLAGNPVEIGDVNLETQSIPLRALVIKTFVYSVGLAIAMQAAHSAMRVALSLITGIAAPEALTGAMGELTMKTTWSVIVCEGLVLVSILARRIWIAATLIAGVGMFVGVMLGGWLRSFVEVSLAQASAFNAQAVFDLSVLAGFKYVFLGPTIAWIKRQTTGELRHYLFGGSAAAIIAALISLFAPTGANAVTRGGMVAVDALFPIGCALVVWKMHQLTAATRAAHQQARAALKNI